LYASSNRARSGFVKEVEIDEHLRPTDKREIIMLLMLMVESYAHGELSATPGREHTAMGAMLPEPLLCKLSDVSTLTSLVHS
jgi:hypothetical protein